MMTLAEAEILFNAKFGADGWDVSAYLSPAEKVINKPILTETNRTTNRMGHPRVWPGPDTPLVEAVFYSLDKNAHTMVFSTTEAAIGWLAKQDPSTGLVEL